jgi:hypothetical protein
LRFKLENIEQEAENSLSTIASWRTFQVESVEVTEERRRKNKRQRKKKKIEFEQHNEHNNMGGWY